MRSTNDMNDPTVGFEEDAPDGGCIVMLPISKRLENTNNMGDYDEPYYDEGVEVFYPSWCEW